MKYKGIILLSIIMMLIICLPRPSGHNYEVESIIDYDKGISVHYPKTGDEKLDDRIYAYISRLIREHDESGKRDALLSVSFDCYSSVFTVIRFKITLQKQSSTRSTYLTNTRYNYFFTLKKNEPVMTIAYMGGEKSEESPKGKKLVALTFDDGPSEHTISILNTLDNYGVKATFCVLGTKVGSYSSTIEIMHSGGHEIANHTFSHQKLTSLKDDEMQKEVQRTQDAVYNITGEYPTFLRPTYGAINSRVRTGIDLPLLMWSKDTLDWKSRDANYIFSQAINGLNDGDIILFHDIYPSTAEAIEKLIPYLLDNGYCPVTAKELFALRGKEPSSGTAYFSSKDST